MAKFRHPFMKASENQECQEINGQLLKTTMNRLSIKKLLILSMPDDWKYIKNLLNA